MPARFNGHGRTVSNRIAVLAMEAAGRAGLSPQLFTARTGISEQELVDRDGRIEGERHRRVVELLETVARMAPDKPRMLFPEFPVLGNLCLNARTLREALAAFHTFRPLISDFDLLCYRETPDYAQFEYIAEFAPNNGFQALAIFQILANLIRAYDVAQRTLFHVSLMRPALPKPHDVDGFFGAPIAYDADANRLRFASTLLDVPFIKYNAALAPFLQEQAQRELLRVKRGHLFSSNVENLISEIITDTADDRPTSSSLLAQICGRLNTSRWTLHRQLQSEGLHFTELEARVKFEEACRLLRDTRLCLGRISEQLGFSSQSAFTRFFRTRHELPPVAFRRAARVALGQR